MVLEIFRRWARSPSRPIGLIAILALGLGFVTSVFSVVDAVLFRSEPWPFPDRLVVVHEVVPEQRRNPATATTWNRAAVSWHAWQRLSAAPAFELVGAWFSRKLIYEPSHSRVEEVEQADVWHVSSSFLDILAIRPTIGRLFGPAEDQSQADIVVISYDLWSRRFGSSTDVLGQQDTPAVRARVRGFGIYGCRRLAARLSLSEPAARIPATNRLDALESEL